MRKILIFFSWIILLAYVCTDDFTIAMENYLIELERRETLLRSQYNMFDEQHPKKQLNMLHDGPDSDKQYPKEPMITLRSGPYPNTQNSQKQSSLLRSGPDPDEQHKNENFNLLHGRRDPNEQNQGNTSKTLLSAPDPDEQLQSKNFNLLHIRPDPNKQNQGNTLKMLRSGPDSDEQSPKKEMNTIEVGSVVFNGLKEQKSGKNNSSDQDIFGSDITSCPKSGRVCITPKSYVYCWVQRSSTGSKIQKSFSTYQCSGECISNKENHYCSETKNNLAFNPVLNLLGENNKQLKLEDSGLFKPIWRIAPLEAILAQSDENDS